MRLFCVALNASLLFLTVGCGRDLKQTADSMVESDLQTQPDRVSAIEFFESGGSYCDDEDGLQVDRGILLPLLKKLKETSGTAQWVLPSKDDPKRAYSVLVELPVDQALEESMAGVIDEADGRFDGLILQQWGHKWLSLDFLDKESVDFFKQSDPDFEKQR